MNKLSRSAIIILLPACTAPFSGDDPVRLRCEAAQGLPLRSLDVFFFNDDPLRRLDAYQRFENAGPVQTGASRSGAKIVVALANASADRYTWAEINSYERLMETLADFSREDPAMPVMSGEARVGPGSDRSCTLTLRPLLAEVEVASLSCDFHGRPYEGAVLEDVRLYLTNIGGLCPAFCGEEVAPGGILNAGALKPGDMAGLAHAEMVLSELDGPVGVSVRHLGRSLFCYPNTVAQEGLGTPFTRLVIEGKLEGRTYYYPLNVGRGALAAPDAPPGLVRGGHYRYDITITRRGSTDPDAAMETGAVEVRLLTDDWQDGGGATIRY